MAAFATDLYDAIEAGAMEHGVRLQRGLYAGVLGPSYEARAEIRMLRRMGADAVGMSTLAEVAAANHLPMRIVGLSLITNTLSDTARITLDHEDVVEQGRLARKRMRTAINAAMAVLDG
jgi:purine-nucleoside phosphorylase